jgi:hypothetical protein
MTTFERWWQKNKDKLWSISDPDSGSYMNAFEIARAAWVAGYKEGENKWHLDTKL